MSTKLDIKVFNDQVMKELADANEKFHPVSSDHEGYAVLLEEFEELVMEIQMAKNQLSYVWNCTRKGNSLELQKELIKMRTHLRKGYKELVQTAAMVEKWLDRYRPDPGQKKIKSFDDISKFELCKEDGE